MSRKPVDKVQQYNECIEAMNLCETRQEFYNTYPRQYHILRSTQMGQNALNAKFPKNDWTNPDTCISEGKKYARRVDFRSKAPRAHDKLYHEHNRALLEEVFPLAHVNAKIIASAMLIKSMYKSQHEFALKRPRVASLINKHLELHEAAKIWLAQNPTAKPIAW